MTASIRCLCLAPDGTDPSPGEPFSVVTRSTSNAVQDYLDRHSAGLDCVIVVDRDPVDAEGVLESLGSAYPGLALVAVTGDRERCPRLLAAGATDCLLFDDGDAVTRTRIRNAVARFRETGDGDRTREKIRELHDTAATLERCETEDEIYELTVDAAERILAFDQCYVGLVEDGKILPQAANAEPLLADPVIMTVEEGLAGKTVREGRTYVVGHPDEDPDTNPVDESYTSALSIPLGGIGLFQAVAVEEDAFDDTDRELGELLMNHVASSIERVRYESALKRQRDRFAALFENVPDAAVGFTYRDGEPIVERVNPAFEAVFGYDAETAVGEPVADLLVPEDDAGTADQFRQEVRDGETVEAGVERVTADGERRHTLLRTVPVETDGATSGYAIYTDISDLKERERELQRQNERLQQFAGVVSHDLRSPLNVAEGYLRTALLDESVDPVEEALASLDRMNRLIDDLLALARQGRTVGDPEPVDVDEVVTGAWRTAGPSDVAFEHESVGTVEGDAGRLRELFENVFRNVGEHAPEATVVRVGPLPDRPGVYVADDGPGIPEDRRDSVFETGHTTDTEGTGFGLAIVAEIAEAHGWTVDVEDGADGGTKFVVAFDAGIE